MENNNQRNNSLFALEQRLLGKNSSPQKSQQPSALKRKRRQEEARAFDWNESIELQYNSNAFDQGEEIELSYSSDAFPTATPEAMSFSAPNSFASELEDESLPFEVEAFEVDEEVIPVTKQVTPQPEMTLELEDESLPFEVEAFEVDEEVIPVTKQVTPQPETTSQPEITEDSPPKPMEVEPVKVTVVPPSEIPLRPASPVKQPTTVESISDQQELSDSGAFAADLQAILNEPTSVEPISDQEELSDAKAFAADLQAILNGEKTYDSEQQQVVSTSPTAKPAPPTSHPHDIFDQGKTANSTPPQQPAEPETPSMSRSHAVFDQMGKNMAHATDFDQGTVNLALEQTFDEFDRILDEKDFAFMSGKDANKSSHEVSDEEKIEEQKNKPLKRISKKNKTNVQGVDKKSQQTKPKHQKKKNNVNIKENKKNNFVQIDKTTGHVKLQGRPSWTYRAGKQKPDTGDDRRHIVHFSSVIRPLLEKAINNIIQSKKSNGSGEKKIISIIKEEAKKRNITIRNDDFVGVVEQAMKQLNGVPNNLHNDSGYENKGIETIRSQTENVKQTITSKKMSYEDAKQEWLKKLEPSKRTSEQAKYANELRERITWIILTDMVKNEDETEPKKLENLKELMHDIIFSTGLDLSKATNKEQTIFAFNYEKKARKIINGTSEKDGTPEKQLRWVFTLLDMPG